MSNQLEFEICASRVQVYMALLNNALDSTERYLEDEEVFLDFSSKHSTMYSELIGKKIFFKCFSNLGATCSVYYYDDQLRKECWHVSTDLIKFKEYE